MSKIFPTHKEHTYAKKTREEKREPFDILKY